MELHPINLKLIPLVGAQSNTVAQPTFGILNVQNSGTQNSSVSLNSTTTSIAPGQTFTVDIFIATNSISIKEYRAIISYDSTKLSVLDANTNQGGTQIQFLDTFFVVDGANNIADNVNNTITLIAKTPTGNSTPVNRAVARVTFQAQQLGSTTISLKSGATGTQLINQNSVAIVTTLNNKTINVAQGQTPNPTPTPPISSSTSSSSGSVIIPPGSTIPDTAIQPSVAAPIILGGLLIALGAALSRSKSE